jgi:hypothetical protein
MSSTNAPAEAPQRVGMILKREGPMRLVHRFGYTVAAKVFCLDNERFVNVLWDDGEYDLVERKDLRPLSAMNENPLRYPIIGFTDEISDLTTRRQRLGR